MEIINYIDKYKDEVVNLILNIQNNEAKINLTLDEQPDLLNINSYYKNGGFWLAIDNDKVVGTIGLMVENNGCGILKKFFVNSAYRGQKVGYALYKVLLNFAMSKNLHYIILDTPSVATASHKFYEKAGFKRVSKNDLPIKYEYPDRNSYLYMLKL